MAWIDDWMWDQFATENLAAGWRRYLDLEGARIRGGERSNIRGFSNSSKNGTTSQDVE